MLLYIIVRLILCKINRNIFALFIGHSDFIVTLNVPKERMYCRDIVIELYSSRCPTSVREKSGLVI